MLLRRMLIMLAAVIAVVAILAGYKVYSIRQQIALFSAPKPPISVTASLAEKRPWQSRLPAIGSLKAFQGVTPNRRSLRHGTRRTVPFRRPGEAGPTADPVGKRRRGSHPAHCRGRSRPGQAEYQRGRELIGSKAISKSEFDRLAAQWPTSATVAELKAALAKKRVLAPFAGTIGIRQVDVGDYVSPGTPIATLQDLSTLLLDFHLPEQDFPCSAAASW